MKKIISVLLMTVLAAALISGCGKNDGAVAKDYTADELLGKVKEAYGDTYLPNTPITDEILKDTFGLDMDKIDDIAAEMPMIGFHPDRVIIVKAKSGEGENVEKALSDARERLVSETMFYPANMAKVNASKVVRHGDYVAFLLVGAADDVSESDEAAAKFAEDETKKGLDAFDAMFA